MLLWCVTGPACSGGESILASTLEAPFLEDDSRRSWSARLTNVSSAALPQSEEVPVPQQGFKDPCKTLAKADNSCVHTSAAAGMLQT